MTPQLWIGLCFLAFLLIILSIPFFNGKSHNLSQYNTLKFFTSLSAGFAGGFFTGEALFHIDSTMGNGVHIIVSGTTGCALFFTIWFTYAKFKDPNPAPATPAPPSFSLDIPPNWSFEYTVSKIVRPAGGTYVINGFTQAEKKSILNAQFLETPSSKIAIERLKFLSNSLPDYTVTENQNNFEIIKI